MSHWLVGEPEWPEVAQLSLDWLASRGVGLAPAKKPKRGQLSLFGLGERADA
jgi:hypothetical protein